MKKSAYAFALAVLLTAAPVAAADMATCADVTKQEIASLFERWNASLMTGKPEAVADNYAPDAVLLPTVSNKPRTDRAGIVDYFEHFLQKKPRGMIDTRTIFVGCNEAADVGTYTFSITDAAGKMSDVAARYTYLYSFKNGKWLIQHHHSSAMPEKVAAPAEMAPMKLEEKAEAKPEVKAEEKVEAKPEAKLEAKPEVKPEVKAEEKVEKKEDVKTEEPKAEKKEAPAPEKAADKHEEKQEKVEKSDKADKEEAASREDKDEDDAEVNLDHARFHNTPFPKKH